MWIQRALRGFFVEVPTVPLGRWCHPTSHAYRHTCDQMRKMALANTDSCMGFRPYVTETRLSRDPITVLVADGYGF